MKYDPDEIDRDLLVFATQGARALSERSRMRLRKAGYTVWLVSPKIWSLTVKGRLHALDIDDGNYKEP